MLLQKYEHFHPLCSSQLHDPPTHFHLKLVQKFMQVFVDGSQLMCPYAFMHSYKNLCPITQTLKGLKQ